MYATSMVWRRCGRFLVLLRCRCVDGCRPSGEPSARDDETSARVAETLGSNRLIRSLYVPDRRVRRFSTNLYQPTQIINPWFAPPRKKSQTEPGSLSLCCPAPHRLLTAPGRVAPPFPSAHRSLSLRLAEAVRLPVGRLGRGGRGRGRGRGVGGGVEPAVDGGDDEERQHRRGD
jgi:hypothetical protein